MTDKNKPRIQIDRKANDAFRRVSEKPENAESRRRETGEQIGWRPLDDGRGTREDTGPGLSEGKKFPQERRPDRGR
jgi:hypothetical protein